jgi:Amt family ammonium transporter
LQSIAELAYAVDTLFVLLAGVLVMFMQAGFALVESGLHSAKNAVNIFMKNFADFSVAGLAFWIIGFNLMYGGSLMLQNYTNDSLPVAADFFFQMVFAGTTATIVSGAVGGRMRFMAYLIFSMIMTALIYPYLGSWTWGGGWLSQLGFTDFAGSTIVHAVGGFAALGAVLALGPRMGRYSRGQLNGIPGHNLTLAGLGVFILWLGWFGFNPGSQLAISSAEDAKAVANIFLTTNLAAASGALAALFVSWIWSGKPDYIKTLSGVLAGLVAITAGTAAVSPAAAVVIGVLGALIAVVGMRLFDTLRVDDPVGAVSVHGLAGIWGTLAVGIFGGADLSVQALGTFLISAVALVAGFLVFTLLRYTVGLRVSPEAEDKGLDSAEHGTEAYAL